MKQPNEIRDVAADSAELAEKVEKLSDELSELVCGAKKCSEMDPYYGGKIQMLTKDSETIQEIDKLIDELEDCLTPLDEFAGHSSEVMTAMEKGGSLLDTWWEIRNAINSVRSHGPDIRNNPKNYRRIDDAVDSVDKLEDLVSELKSKSQAFSDSIPSDSEFSDAADREYAERARREMEQFSEEDF